MELSASGKTNRCYGCGPWGPLANMIEVDLPDFGTAIRRISMTIYCNGHAPVFQTYPEGFEIWRPEGMIGPTYFPPLNYSPKVRFLRKKRELEILYPSEHFSPADTNNFHYPTMTREVLSIAKVEILQALEWGLGQAVKKKDDFDTNAFLKWIENWRGLEVDLHRPLIDLVLEAHEIWMRRRQSADPWLLLDIDWSRVHPDARKLLDSPDDWSQSNDFSPHGSDTGADIWADWRSYSRLTPQGVALKMGWNAGDPEQLDVMRRDWLEIHMALAFGQLKKKGICSPDLAEATHRLLEESREYDDFISPDHLADWEAKRSRYQRILQEFVSWDSTQ